MPSASAVPTLARSVSAPSARRPRQWRHEGLKVPMKQPKRGRLNDESCIRLRPCWPNHVWAYDFVLARTLDGRAFRMLTIIDEYSRECLAILVARHIRSDDVLYLLAELFANRDLRSPHLPHRQAPRRPARRGRADPCGDEDGRIDGEG